MHKLSTYSKTHAKSCQAQYPAHLGQLGCAHFKYLLSSVFIFVSLLFLPVRVIDVINWPLVQETFSYAKAFLKRNRLYSAINHLQTKAYWTQHMS